MRQRSYAAGLRVDQNNVIGLEASSIGKVTVDAIEVLAKLKPRCSGLRESSSAKQQLREHDHQRGEFEAGRGSKGSHSRL